MKKINENVLAKEIAQAEGKRIQVNIGQIKEIQKVLLDKLAAYDLSQVSQLLDKHKQ
jgi:hypothetical protein